MRFERPEYQTRLDRVREAMHRRGLEVLVVSDPANMYYLTGYDGWSFYVPQVIVVELNTDQPIWIGRGIDANAARLSTSLPSEHIVAYGDEYVHSLISHPMDIVAEYLQNREWDAKIIGLEMDAAYFSAAGYESLRRSLSNGRFRDAGNLVNWVRFEKSPQEIVYMRQAARILERVYAVAFDAIAPGVRQCDVASKIYQAQVQGTEEFGGDYTAIAPMLPSGIGTSTPHLTWSDAPFVEGECTIMELAAARYRYHCPMARTVHLGTPPRHITDTVKVVIEGIQNVLDAAEPGITAEHLEIVWRTTIERHGISKESRMGYSIGIGYPPDWGERTMSIRPGDKTILRPNCTFHLMPGIWMNDWGVEISEPVLVTDSGCESLANVNRDLFVKV